MMSTVQSTWVALVCVQTRFVGVAEPETETFVFVMPLSSVTWMAVSVIEVEEAVVTGVIVMTGDMTSMT